MEYILWCDESISKGTYYSDFYGGILVRSDQLLLVNQAFNDIRVKHNYYSEFKWSKVTEHYVPIYSDFMKKAFELLREGRLKVRIMFRQSAYEAQNVNEHQRVQKYFLLYYQFIKHAFGFQFAGNIDGSPISLRTYFDDLPDTKVKCDLFKSYVYGLQSTKGFKEANIKIERENIAEVNSKSHIELQCLDVILGAMAFRLNNMHLLKPEGSRTRGKRTIAKEKLYKLINKEIRTLYPNFNIGTTTGKSNGWSDLWNHPYRHWNFRPRDFRVDESKFK